MKTVYFVIPCYNEEEVLPLTALDLVDKLEELVSAGAVSARSKVLLVDDGSTDGTGALVAGWQAEGRIEIQYAHKTNGGMHTAHNLAYDLVKTELNVCIDSDDWMPDDAVALILSRWAAVRDHTELAGIVGLDQSPEGALIGTALPADGTRCTLAGLYAHHGVRGDKKLVYRSDIVRAFPRYPEFAGERLVPLSWLYELIDQQYELVAFNLFAPPLYRF